MQQYLDVLRHVRETGTFRGDRTGTGTQSVFGQQMRFDLSAGFPVLTTKKLHLKSIIHELLWFLAGDTNIKYLNDNGVRIWDEWANENGELGPVYGHQWRSWPTPDGGTIDQVQKAIDDIKTNPNSRRHIVSAWNVAEVNKMALPPCHCLFQFYVADGKIASYALLTMMMAQVSGLKAGDFVHTLGDAHLYANHLDQADLQLTRKPLALPTMHINLDIDDIFAFTFEDFELAGYEAHPHIAAPIAV